MLSRTADHLYWMARYTERAENMARMLDVNNRMSLLPQGGEVVQQSWMATLSITGLAQAYQERFGHFRPATALRFLAFDRENPSSIYSCLRAARENARAVRDTLTAEIWETVNSTWLEAHSRVDASSESDMASVFEWVKYRSHLARGVIHGTMLRDDAFHFTWLGTYLERADNTARILDVKYHMLLPRGEAAGGVADYYQWSALLHSVSAFEVYRKVYRDLITPRRVAQLLVLRSDLPRSLRCCMAYVYEHVKAVRNSQSAETERRAGEVQASLQFARIDDIFEKGLHEYLMEFLARTHDLGERVGLDFLVATNES